MGKYKQHSIKTYKSLRTVFDENFIVWESLQPGDPDRERLVIENEEILRQILND